MSMHLIREIEKLKKKLLALSAVVEENVRRAVTAIQRRDQALAQRVITLDLEIDQSEIDVEEECLKILALHQPVAIDLRFIVAVLKINNDLERIGDLAVNIAGRAIGLATETTPPTPFFDLHIMAEKAQSMLKRSLDSLVSLNTQLANKVCADDDEVDALHRRMYDQVEAEIRKNPESMHALIQLLSVSRCLERIADLATNIAEDITYMLQGEIVRHGGEHPTPPGSEPTNT